MKKLLAGILVVLTLVCVLSVVGCEPDENPATTTTTTIPCITTTTTDPTTTDPFDPCPTTATTVPKSTTTTTVPPTTSSQPNTTCNHYPACNCGQWVNPRDSANWKKVVKNVFTSDKGGLQMKAEGWKTFDGNGGPSYGISMVPKEYNHQGVTNAISVSVYAPDPVDMFDAKNEEDFRELLNVEITSLDKTTVCDYPAYYVTVEGLYYLYAINTPNYKYYIVFMHAEGFPDIEPIGKSMMETVTIYK